MTEPDTNSTDRAVAPKQPLISNYGLVLTVYVLYLAGFLTGISVIIGVIIAYLVRDETDEICRSHFQFQISTFWIGLVYVLVGFLTIHIVIGGFILIWWTIWTLIRCVKGLLLLNKGSAIPDPNSWWFGE